MILLVTGGRRYAWTQADSGVLNLMIDYLGVTDLWHGGAVGVDTCAAQVAVARGLGVRVFYPEPALLPEDFERAPMVRNGVMVDELVDAIKDGATGAVAAFPGGTGTRDCVSKALRRQLHVIDLRARGLARISA